jgi:hypothetical protein
MYIPTTVVNPRVLATSMAYRHFVLVVQLVLATSIFSVFNVFEIAR